MALRMTHDELGDATCATEAQFHALHEANGWRLVEPRPVAPDPTDEERAAALAALTGAPALAVDDEGPVTFTLPPVGGTDDPGDTDPGTDPSESQED